MDDYTLGFILGRTLLGVIVGLVVTTTIVVGALVVRRLVDSDYPVPALVAKTGFFTAVIVVAFVTLEALVVST